MWLNVMSIARQKERMNGGLSVQGTFLHAALWRVRQVFKPYFQVRLTEPEDHAVAEARLKASQKYLESLTTAQKPKEPE